MASATRWASAYASTHGEEMIALLTALDQASLFVLGMACARMMLPANANGGLGGVAVNSNVLSSLDTLVDAALRMMRAVAERAETRESVYAGKDSQAMTVAWSVRERTEYRALEMEIVPRQGCAAAQKHGPVRPVPCPALAQPGNPAPATDGVCQHRGQHRFAFVKLDCRASLGATRVMRAKWASTIRCRASNKKNR
eukprot:2370875-Rhodomonas_salina.2